MTQHAVGTAARTVSIFDTTLRDGEQAPKNAMSPDRKLRTALSLQSLGVDVVEVGFPASSPSERIAAKAIAEALTTARCATFNRAVQSDVLASVECAGVDNHQAQIMATGSDMHLVHKRGITRAEAVAEVGAAVRFASSLGLVDISVPIEDASRGEDDLLKAITETSIDGGATTIVLGDTSGCLTPAEYGDLVAKFRTWVPDTITISTHCHDDLGLSLANALAGIEAGADEVQATLGGIGERAGNTALEELAAVLFYKGERLGLSTRLDTTLLYDAYTRLRSMIGLGEPRNKPLVGTYAFSTAAGIHQQGMLADPSTYEFVRPEDFGRERQILVSRHSGRVVLRHLLEQLGHRTTEKELEALYETLIAAQADGACEGLASVQASLEELLRQPVADRTESAGVAGHMAKH